MLITYLPEGGEPEEYEFNPRKLKSRDSEAIEEVGGASWMTFEQFGMRFMAGSQKAYRAALWICKRRENPRLRFEDLSIGVDEIVVGYSPVEQEQIRQSIADDPDLDPVQKKNLLSLIDTTTNAEANEALAEVGVKPSPDLPEQSPNSGDEDSKSALPV
jgi:hypothetical protein